MTNTLGFGSDNMEILRVIIWAAIYAAYGLMVSCSVADDEERKEHARTEI